MLCVNVELQERRYPILIGSGLLQDERSYPIKRGDRVMIVTNPTVAQSMPWKNEVAWLIMFYCQMAKNTKRLNL